MPKQTVLPLAGVAALLPLVTEALRDAGVSRRVREAMNTSRLRHAGDLFVDRAEKRLHNAIAHSRAGRQFASNFAPRPSPWPGIAMFAVGAGVVWAYMSAKARKKAAEGEDGEWLDEGAPTPIRPAGRAGRNGKSGGAQADRMSGDQGVTTIEGAAGLAGMAGSKQPDDPSAGFDDKSMKNPL
jgi:hypothetical protein